MTGNDIKIMRGSYTLTPDEKNLLEDLVKKFQGITPRINKSEIIRIGITEVNKKAESEIIETLNNLGRFVVGKPKKQLNEELEVSELKVSDKQWKKISELLQLNQQLKQGGRPKTDYRQVINGILYIFRYEKQRRIIPKEYGSFATCRRRLNDWDKNNKWKEICIILLSYSSDSVEKTEFQRALLRTLLIDTQTSKS